MKRNAVLEISSENIVSEVKRNLLFFDKLVFDNSQLITIRNYLKSFNKFQKLEQDEIDVIISYLQSKEVMLPFEINNEDKIEAAKYNGKPETLEMINEFQEWSKHTDGVTRKHKDEIIAINKKLASGLLTPDDPTFQSSISKMIMDRQNLGDMSCRLISNLYSMIKPGQIFIPVVNNDPQYIKNIPTEKQKVIRLILNNIPTPDNGTPIDEILDFRKGKEQTLQYGRLISWISKIGSESLNQYEIEEEFNHLINEYEDGLNKLGSKKKLSNLTAIITMPLEIIEKIVKLNWSKIPETILKIKQNEIEFKINELGIPGREIAYIKSAKDKFDN